MCLFSTIDKLNNIKQTITDGKIAPRVIFTFNYLLFGISYNPLSNNRHAFVC